jgi:hypothetical protein
MDVYKIDETKEIEMVVNSFVSEPATEKEWLFFNKRKVLDFYDDEQQIVTSVVMLANTPIYRNDDGYEYKLVFTPEAIKKMAFDYFSKNGFNKISIEHDGKEIEGAAILLESYFVDNVKNVPQKFGKIPDGSWIMSYKVVDKELWQAIKEKKLRGFSIEVVADLKKLSLNLKKDTNQQNKKNMKKEKNKQKFLDAVTDQGVQVRFDALEVGQLIYAIAEDGTEVLLEAGTYLINYENAVYEVVVDENGTITEINEVTSEETMSNNDYKKEMDVMKQKIADLEEKIKTFTTAKPTAVAKKTKPLTDESDSNVRTDFSKIKVKF